MTDDPLNGYLEGIVILNVSNDLM